MPYITVGLLTGALTTMTMEQVWQAMQQLRPDRVAGPVPTSVAHAGSAPAAPTCWPREGTCWTSRTGRRNWPG
ncbi:hypothetical protein [Streptomyces sp. NPDC018347]|uniref:hypothetical protein n=1 Tax=Streptomyces sp. NPDC018347 TaxID=3157193 RepID=UPI0033DA18A9